MGKKLESFILRSQYRNGTFKNIVSVSHCALYRFRLLEIGLIGPKNQQARGWAAEQLTNNRFRLHRVTSTNSGFLFSGFLISSVNIMWVLWFSSRLSSLYWLKAHIMFSIWNKVGVFGSWISVLQWLWCTIALEFQVGDYLQWRWRRTENMFAYSMFQLIASAVATSTMASLSQRKIWSRHLYIGMDTFEFGEDIIIYKLFTNQARKWITRDHDLERRAFKGFKVCLLDYDLKIGFVFSEEWKRQERQRVSRFIVISRFNVFILFKPDSFVKCLSRNNNGSLDFFWFKRKSINRVSLCQYNYGQTFGQWEGNWIIGPKLDCSMNRLTLLKWCRMIRNQFRMMEVEFIRVSLYPITCSEEPNKYKFNESAKLTRSRHVSKIWAWVMDISFNELRIKMLGLLSLFLKYMVRRAIRAGAMVETELLWKGIFTPDLITLQSIFKVFSNESIKLEL